MYFTTISNAEMDYVLPKSSFIASIISFGSIPRNQMISFKITILIHIVKLTFGNVESIFKATF